MDTVRISGIRPKGEDVVIGLYYNIFIDVSLKLNLDRALNGNETGAIDIPQISDRLAFMLRRCEKDDEIIDHPTIALELIANSVADSVMRTWQILEADITVHASLRSDYYGLQSNVDDVSLSLHRVSNNNFEEPTAIPEPAARAAVRSGIVDIDEDAEGELADFYRSLIEENRQEKQRREDEEAAAAAQAAIYIANAAADDNLNVSAVGDDGNSEDTADSAKYEDSTKRCTDLVKNESNSPLFGICPLPMKTIGVVAMKGVAKDSTRSAMLRTVAMLEQDRDSRVEGVSALYVDNELDGDYYTAVLTLSSSGDEYELLSFVRAVSSLHRDEVTVRVLGVRSYNAPATETRTIDTEGLPQEMAKMVMVNPKTPELMPWMQIESDAALDKSPVSYSLALSMDTQTVGVYSEKWLIGDDY